MLSVDRVPQHARRPARHRGTRGHRDHQNPHGFVHGAVIFAMGDTSMGAATMSMLDERQRCSAIERQLRFLRPVESGRLSADTTVVKAGRRRFHLESKVHDAQGRWVAMATGSSAVVAASVAESEPRSSLTPAVAPPCLTTRTLPLAGRPSIPCSQRSKSAQCIASMAVSYTHLRAHETRHDLVCRLLLE